MVREFLSTFYHKLYFIQVFNLYHPPSLFQCLLHFISVENRPPGPRKARGASAILMMMMKSTCLGGIHVPDTVIWLTVLVFYLSLNVVIK